MSAITVRPFLGPGHAVILIDTVYPLNLEGFHFTLVKKRGEFSLGMDGRWHRTPQPLQAKVENRDGKAVVYVGPAVVNNIDEGEGLILTINTAASGATPALSGELQWPRLGKSSGTIGNSPFDPPKRPPPAPPPPPGNDTVHGHGSDTIVMRQDKSQEGNGTLGGGSDGEPPREEPPREEPPREEPPREELPREEPPREEPPEVKPERPPWRLIAIVGGLCVLLFAAAAFWFYGWPELQRRLEEARTQPPLPPLQTDGTDLNQIADQVRRLIEEGGDVGRILDGAKRLLDGSNPQLRDLGTRAIDHAATRGSVPAMFELGRLFDPNHFQAERAGMERADPTAAGYWYKKATEAGSADARAALREMCTKISQPAPGLNEQQRTDAVAQYCI